MSNTETVPETKNLPGKAYVHARHSLHHIIDKIASEIKHSKEVK